MLSELYAVKSLSNDTKVPSGISIRKLEGEILSGRIATLHIFYSCAILHSGVGFYIKFMCWYITFYKCYYDRCFIRLIMKVFFGQNYISQDPIQELSTPTSEV